MTTNHTSDPSTTNTIRRMTRSGRVRLAAVALAIVGVSGAGGFAAGAQQPDAAINSPSAVSSPVSNTSAMNRAMARFAAENNLTGLSPASLGPIPAETLAQFARENNLTGLSPASLAPIEVDDGEE